MGDNVSQGVRQRSAYGQPETLPRNGTAPVRLDELLGEEQSTNNCFILRLPWALVEIEGRLRCAYEFGALKCFIRQAANAVAEDCHVALEPPINVLRNLREREHFDWIMFTVSICGCAVWGL